MLITTSTGRGFKLAIKNSRGRVDFSNFLVAMRVNSISPGEDA